MPYIGANVSAGVFRAWDVYCRRSGLTKTAMLERVLEAKLIQVGVLVTNEALDLDELAHEERRANSLDLGVGVEPQLDVAPTRLLATPAYDPPCGLCGNAGAYTDALDGVLYYCGCKHGRARQASDAST